MLLSLNPSCPSFKAPIFRKTEQSVVQQLSTCTELPLSASAMTDVQSEAEPLVEKVMPGWMEEIEETLVLSQQESEESALADACRISSDEESIDEESAAMTVPCSPQTSDDARIHLESVGRAGCESKAVLRIGPFATGLWASTPCPSPSPSPSCLSH